MMSCIAYIVGLILLGAGCWLQYPYCKGRPYYMFMVFEYAPWWTWVMIVVGLLLTLPQIYKSPWSTK